MDQRALPWAVLFIVQLLYCIWHVLGKKALNRGMSPYVLALYREIGACICMTTFSRIVDGRFRLFHVRSFDAWRLLLLGVLGFGNIYGFIVALSYVTSFNSALLHPIIPVVSAFVAGVTGVERLTKRKAAGVFVSAAGAVVVVVFGVARDSNSEGDSNSSPARVLVGNLILLGQCVCMGALLVLQKALLDVLPVKPTTLTLLYNVVATLLAFVTTLFIENPFVKGLEPFLVRSSIEIIATLYGALVGIAVIYVALGWATTRAGPTVTALSMTLQGPLNAVLAVLFLGRTSFTLGEVLGGFIICVGLAVTVTDPTVHAGKQRKSSSSSDGVVYRTLGDDDRASRDADDDDSPATTQLVHSSSNVSDVSI